MHDKALFFVQRVDGVGFIEEVVVDFRECKSLAGTARDLHRVGAGKGGSAD